MVLPLVKLGTLAVRTLAKPIASRLKQQAGNYPKFRRFIIDVAQLNHRFSTTIQRHVYSHRTDVAIRPLNEEKAVQAAADLIGELFVFTVAVAAIMYEVQRNARAEARKEESRRQELEAIRQKGENLAREVELMRKKLSEIEKIAGIFNFKKGRLPEGCRKATA